MYIQISSRRNFSGTVSSFSTEEESFRASQVIADSGAWQTKHGNSIRNEQVTIDYNDIITIDQIEIHAGPSGPSYLPADFRFEYSIDGKEWQIVHAERNFQTDEKSVVISIPLTILRYLRLFISRPVSIDGRYIVEIGRIIAGIAGIRECLASSASSIECGPAALFDDKDNFWETETRPSASKESIDIDLGQTFILNKITLESHTELPGFPENISIEASSDRKVWVPLVDEKRFRSDKGQIYSWSLDAVNTRHLRVECGSVKIGEGSFIVRIVKMGIFAAPVDDAHAHSNSGNPPHASIFQGGLVRLAKDGEDSKGAAIQANDRRLRDGTTRFKGIVQLAESGETKEGLVVQSSDSRLKTATEAKEGIVRLAYDGERKAGTAIQGSDIRLKEASENSFGIVRLCPNGAYSETGIVRGNDIRLMNATIKSAGIVRLAADGGAEANSVVQGNDKRLKDASTSSVGIVELADDGEDKPKVVVQGNDRRLKDATVSSKGIVELAEDGEDKQCVAVQGNDRRLKDATDLSKGIMRFAKDGEDAPLAALQGNDKRIKDATDLSKGILRFAKDGEDAPLAALQGNDKRIKDATDLSKGILRFAKDGEDAPLAALQGNDKRIKDATTISKGIVELADDGEDRQGVVVQGNDKRLKDATDSAKGVVRFAKNGEESPHAAVQGSDKRLRDATTESKGIVELADDGEDRQGVAVQGNDRRLKDATALLKGILRFAQDGEDAPLAALQGNDRRIKDATTISKGIVELADDGEAKQGVVVQGNDSRLRIATEDTAGIVRLAKNNEIRKGSVVQSDDARLSDQREPLPHNHDYSPRVHEHNSHSGAIALKGSNAQPFIGITAPPVQGSLISAENDSKEKGSVGIIGSVKNDAAAQESYGVIGHSPFVGVRGQSTGNQEGTRGCGVLGVSRFGAGGVFSSEHDYSVIINGYGHIGNYDQSVKLLGEGKAMQVSGSSVFNGSIRFGQIRKDSGEHPGNIVELFRTNDTDYISPGDLLVVAESGDSRLVRSSHAYQKSVIGVVSGNPAVIINNSGEEEKAYPVALCGKALCKVDARENSIVPGDLIVTSETPGCGMKGIIDSFDKIGTVIGKALESAEDGIGTIAIFVMHQ